MSLELPLHLTLPHLMTITIVKSAYKPTQPILSHFSTLLTIDLCRVLRSSSYGKRSSKLYLAHRVAEVCELCHLGFGEWILEVH